MLLHLFILHILSFTYTAHTHVVFYIHGTFICSSYTCCLLHTRHIHLFILHMLSFTFICSSYACCRLHTRDIHLFILHMLSFTYTGHSFVHPTHVAFYIHGTFICSSYTCCLLHTGHSFESRPECECVFDSSLPHSGYPSQKSCTLHWQTRSYICNLRLHSGMHVKEWVSDC